MKLFKVLPLIACLGFVGCGESTTESNKAEQTSTNKVEQVQTEQAKKESDTNQEYVSPLPDDAPVYKVATTGTQPPFTFKNEAGLLQGIDIDSIRAIGELEGFKVEFYQEPWKKLFTTVEQGKRDLAISSISYSDERAKKYTLSKPYLFVPPAIVYKKSKFNIKGLSDLEGLNFGALDGSIQIEDVKSSVKDITIVPSKTMYLAYTNLVRDETDVVAGDMQELQYRAIEYPDYEFTVVPYRTEEEPSAHFVIMMNKDNVELAKKVNDGIDKLKAQGKFDDIEAKWLKKK